MVTGSVVDAIDRLLEGLELDDETNAKAAIARALARQLDSVVGPDAPASMVLATAGIAKELREVVNALLETTGEDDEFTVDLFSEVGNSADT
jgi:hypothetical protein